MVEFPNNGLAQAETCRI